VTLARVPLFYSDVGSDDKLVGITLHSAGKLYEKVDFLLVEADGARDASFKIPRPHEPVLPEATTHLCIVVGSEVFELPPEEGLFFHFDELRKLVDFPEEEVTPPGTLRKLLFREDGYLRHATAARRTFLLLNKVDSTDRVEALLPVAGELFHPALENIVLTSAEPGVPAVSIDNARDRIAAVVLAAGKSERFGGQKLCEQLDGEPLIQRVVRQALESKLDSVCVVLGYEADRVRGCIDILKSHTALMTIENRSFSEGIGRSIAEGISAVSQWADAAMIILADMPGVDPELIDAVIGAYKKSNARLCYPAAGGRPGHPVIFRKDFFADLMKLGGDEGARKIVEGNRQWAKVVKLSGERSQADVDTPADLGKW
jgi:CTP:molybdopterin cytidylyltransferase MocA